MINEIKDENVNKYKNKEKDNIIDKEKSEP